MAASLPARVTFAPQETSKIAAVAALGRAPVSLGVVRLPTDPVYLADVTLQNVVPGSRIWMANNADLSQTLLDSFIAANESQEDPILLEGVPAYSTQMLICLRARKASGAPCYQPYETFAYHSPNGIVIWVAQVADGVVSCPT